MLPLMQFERFISVIEDTPAQPVDIAPFNTNAGALFKLKNSNNIVWLSALSIAQEFSKEELSLNLDSDFQHYNSVSAALRAIFHHETVGSPETNSPEKLEQWSSVMHAIGDGRLNPDGTISKLEFTV